MKYNKIKKCKSCKYCYNDEYCLISQDYPFDYNSGYCDNYSRNKKYEKENCGFEIVDIGYVDNDY